MEVHDRLYDVIIVGAGPAGLSAAIYAARAKYHVLVLEKNGIADRLLSPRRLSIILVWKWQVEKN